MEMPDNIDELKVAHPGIARAFVNLNNLTYPILFANRYSAVDTTIVRTNAGTKSCVVLMKNFDEQQSNCLMEAISK